MKYLIDHDYHIHSAALLCCRDEKQTPEGILAFAEKSGYRKICVTNHYFDAAVNPFEGWHPKHTYPYISSDLPLPQGKKVKFCFGTETDMDKYLSLEVPAEKIGCFDFITVATTHLGLKGLTVERGIKTYAAYASLWISKFAALLKADIPFRKFGLAHMTSGHMNPYGSASKTLAKISDETMFFLFRNAAEKGLGIELNFSVRGLEKKDRDAILRPYMIAKKAGCRFYLGSDAHSQRDLFDSKEKFEQMIDALDLKEEDKFDFQGEL